VLFNAAAPRAEPEKAAAQMFLPFPRLRASLHALSTQWFLSEDTFGNTRYEYYRTQLASGRGGSESDLLILTQLLEGLHRRVSTELLLPNTTFNEQATAVKESLPYSTAPEVSKAVADSLRYANELSLRKRLKRLFAMLDPAVTSKI